MNTIEEAIEDIREGKFVTSEDINAHPDSYSPDLQTESNLLGMAAELWEEYFQAF